MRCITTSKMHSNAIIKVLISFSLWFSVGLSQIQTPPRDVFSGFIQHPTHGAIQVSWFYTGNLVAYDGDVIYGTIANSTRS
jgi:hypothetical protein